MNGKFFTSILLFVLFLLSASVAFAEKPQGYFYMGASGGGYRFDSRQDLGTAPVYGLLLGYQFPGKSLIGNLGIEGRFEHGTATSDAADSDVDFTLASLNGIYPLVVGKSWIPFISLGFGTIQFDNGGNAEDDSLVSLGLGLEYAVKENLHLRGEVNRLFLLDPEYDPNLKYTLALVYRFGEKQEKKEEGPPKDSDHDGVSDKEDKCPDTPDGVKVDKNGCPVDTSDEDRDGVPGYRDKCPQTPVGAIVDETGCPADSDKDGVPDQLDRCPGTPGGVKVNRQGCVGPEVEDGGKVSPGPKPVKEANRAESEMPPPSPPEVTVEAAPAEAPTIKEQPQAEKPAAHMEPAAPKPEPIITEKVVEAPKALVVPEKEPITARPEAEAGNMPLTAPPPAKLPTEKITGIPKAVSPQGYLRKEPKTISAMVWFEPYEVSVKAENYSTLREIAQAVKESPDLGVLIEGHADASGGTKLNWRLSRERAKHLGNLLASFGVAPERMEVRWFGESRPIVDNATREGRRMNRRTEVHLRQNH